MNNPIFENELKIRERIKKAFEGIEKTSQTAYDIAFHMTDWLSDMKDLVEVYSNIENIGDDEIHSFVCGFLAHVPNHLNAGHKLVGYGKPEDVFNVGIFDNDE